MNLVYRLLYLYLILRPYYLFESGGIQISDVFLILAFLALIITSRKDKSDIREAIKKNRSYIIFTFTTLIINTIYCITYPDKRFIMSTIYYIFNGCAIVLFYISYKNDHSFIKNLLKIFKINLLIQLALLILGLGRYWYGTRYMGSFNDPNQFGYYILLSYCFIYLLSLKINKKITINLLAYYAICVALVAASISTGMLLGFGVLAILMIIQAIKNPSKEMVGLCKRIAIAALFAVPIIGILFLARPNIPNEIHDKISNMQIFSRVEQKIDRTKSQGNGEEISIIQDRALDYITLYPQYIIIGAGEGGEDRFEKVSHITEIHSTFPAILFYYGIIPTCILLKWILDKTKRLRGQQLVVYVALLAESFTLANQRQALLWAIITLAGFLIEENKQ